MYEGGERTWYSREGGAGGAMKKEGRNRGKKRIKIQLTAIVRGG